MLRSEKKPLISIVTVVYNSRDSIELTMQSILDKKTQNCEYLVIDGNSNDGTSEIIQKYLSQISYIKESDQGIYDAMNKGILNAKGDYIIFINCGDILLELPEDTINKYFGLSLICFPVKLSTGSTFYPKFGKWLKIKNTLPHQGCFYKRSIYLNFNLKYRIFSDFALNQDFYRRGEKVLTLNEPTVAFHDVNGISHNKKYAKEIFSVVKDNFGGFYMCLSFLYFKLHGLKSRLKSLSKIKNNVNIFSGTL